MYTHIRAICDVASPSRRRATAWCSSGHAGAATGAFGGAPCGARARRVRSVSTWGGAAMRVLPPGVSTVWALDKDPLEKESRAWKPVESQSGTCHGYRRRPHRARNPP
eukprot:797912-Pyramimonas_sp.AAC.1